MENPSVSAHVPRGPKNWPKGETCLDVMFLVQKSFVRRSEIRCVGHCPQCQWLRCSLLFRCHRDIETSHLSFLPHLLALHTHIIISLPPSRSRVLQPPVQSVISPIRRALQILCPGRPHSSLCHRECPISRLKHQ
jgi:hypothetical protein